MSYPTKKLTDLLESCDAGAWGKSAVKGEGLFVLRSTNMGDDGDLDFSDVAELSIKDNIEKIKLFDGDILLEKSGGGPDQPVGRVSYFVAPNHRDFAFANFIQRLRVKPNLVNSRFLFYRLLFLHKTGFTKRLQSQTTGIRNLKLSLYLKTEIPLPPLEIQKQIVERLDKIVTAQKLNDELIQKTDELYRSLLHNELNAKFKNQNAKSQFKIKKLGEVAEFKRGPFGGSLKKEIFVNSGYKVYEQSNVIYDDFKSGNYFITEQKYKEMKDFAIKPDDLLISCSGTIGKIAIVPNDGQAGVINQALLKISPLPKVVSTIFLKYLLETPYLQDKLTANTRGSAIRNVASVREIKQIDIFVPSLETQKQIAGKLSAVQKYKAQLLSQKSRLKELFDSVLYNSMT